MAWKSCTCHGEQFRGKSSGYYITFLRGEETDKKYQRLCPSGLSTVLGILSKFGYEDSDPTDGQMAMFSSCGWCGAEREPDSGSAFFVTLYDKGVTKRGFAGATCDAHEGLAASQLLLR